MRIPMSMLKAVSTGTVVLGLLSGCAINMEIPIKDAQPSNEAYKKPVSSAPTALFFKDEQTAEDKAKVLTGLIPMQLVYAGKPYEAVPWVAQQTVKELVVRGLPVTLATDGNNSTSVLIKRVHIVNHRVSAFSPFVTFTSVRADVMTPQGSQRITAYIKRGKVPVMSFNEVIDPTYNDALSVLTKELAAKLNQQLFGQMISNDQVSALIEKIKKNSSTQNDTYLDVYQLGFGNNPAAIPELMRLTSNANEYVRLAAISSLGILKANDQFNFLAGLYETKDSQWQDRAMALKAIGDMNTPKSRAYLQTELNRFKDSTDRESLWTKEIISLYL